MAAIAQHNYTRAYIDPSSTAPVDRLKMADMERLGKSEVEQLLDTSHGFLGVRT